MSGKLQKAEEIATALRHQIQSLKTENLVLRKLAYAVGRNDLVEMQRALQEAAPYLQATSKKTYVAGHVYQAAEKVLQSVSDQVARKPVKKAQPQRWRRV